MVRQLIVNRLVSEQEDGASLLLAFRGLQEESIEQGKLHTGAAQDLQTKIADPFSEWATGYKVSSPYKPTNGP